MLTYNRLQSKFKGLGLSKKQVGQAWTMYKTGEIHDNDLISINIKKLVSTIKKKTQISKKTVCQVSLIKCMKKLNLEAGVDENIPIEMKKKYGEPIRILGKGSYGEVYLHKGINGKKYAIKKMDYIEDIDGGNIDHTSLNELAIMKSMKHVNILDIKDYFISDNLEWIYLVTKAMAREMTNYNDIILNNNCYKTFVYKLLCGVAYMHFKGIIHLDLKPQNIFLSDNELKIADFGESRALTCGKQFFARFELISLPYRGLEILYGGYYDQSVDMWSVGCIIYEIIMNKILFDGNNETDMIQKITSRLGTPTEDNWNGVTRFSKYVNLQYKGNPEFIREQLMKKINNKTDVDEWYNIIISLLQTNPQKRATALEVIKNPFFDEVRNFSLENKIGSCLYNLPSKLINIGNISLIDWMLYKTINFGMTVRVFYIALYLFINILGKLLITDKNSKLYAVSCINIAEAYISTILPTAIFDFTFMRKCRKNTTIEIANMSTKILKKIDFQLVFSTCYDFLEDYGKFYNKNVKKLAEGLLFFTILLPETQSDQLALICLVMASMYYREKIKHKDAITSELLKKIKFFTRLVIPPSLNKTMLLFKLKYSPDNQSIDKILNKIRSSNISI